jgi:hypothetical protein
VERNKALNKNKWIKILKAIQKSMKQWVDSFQKINESETPLTRKKDLISKIKDEKGDIATDTTEIIVANYY